MSKKKHTAVVIANPEVQNNINMNLTHSDIIDVAIQTQLEVLEPLEEDLKKQLTSMQNQEEDLKFNMFNDNAKLGNNLQRGQFEHLVKILSKRENTKYEINLDIYSFNNKETINSSEILMFNYGNFNKGSEEETYKNPHIYFKSNSKANTFNYIIASKASFTLKYSENDIDIKTYITIELSRKEYDKLKKEVTIFLNKKAEIYKKWWDIRLQILELRYNEKKIKAKVVKASLSKTEQGKNILNLLEGATNIKLLE